MKKLSAPLRLCVENIDRMIDAPNGIKRLRELILQLAVQGKLVPQRDSDGTAVDLLKQIKEVKRRDAETRRKNGERVRKTKPLPIIGKEEIPYEIPKGWKWVRFGNIISLMDSGWSPNCLKEPTSDESEWGVIKTTAVQPLSFQPEHHKKLPAHLLPKEEKELHAGDFLITRAGPTYRVGIACFVRECRKRLLNSDKIIRCHFFDSTVDGDFMVLNFAAGYSRDYLKGKQSGMDLAQVNISQSKLNETPVAVAPLQEQGRIVAKVDELMRWCDSLDALKQKRTVLRTAALNASLSKLCNAETQRRGELDDETSSASSRLCVERILPLVTTTALNTSLSKLCNAEPQGRGELDDETSSAPSRLCVERILPLVTTAALNASLSKLCNAEPQGRGELDDETSSASSRLCVERILPLVTTAALNASLSKRCTAEPQGRGELDDEASSAPSRQCVERILPLVTTAALNASLSKRCTVEPQGRGELDDETTSAPSRLCVERILPLVTTVADVKLLRDAILQLAVQGRLVEQRDSDGTADDLLKQIKEVKRRDAETRRKNGERIRKTKPLPSITPEEIPFEIPKHWKWVLLEDLCSYIQRGKGPKYVEKSDYPVVSQKCVQWGGFQLDRARFIDPATLGKYEDVRFLRTGDLLWNSTGTGTIGRINIYNHEDNEYEKVVADSHVTVVRSLLMNSNYLISYLSAPVVQEGFEERASGTTNQIELNTTAVRGQMVSIPPLAEQQRIVAKVDELMGWCDELEALLQTEMETATRFAAAIAKT